MGAVSLRPRVITDPSCPWRRGETRRPVGAQQQPDCPGTATDLPPLSVVLGYPKLPVGLPIMSFFGLRAARPEARVLYVDDDPAVLRAFARTVSSAGWQVDLAANAETALKLARKNAYAVVVADHHMPDMTGEQLIAQLRPLQPHASYVVVTGHSDLAVAACKTPGLFVVISKPWDSETLLTILTACRRRRASSAGARRTA